MEYKYAVIVIYKERPATDCTHAWDLLGSTDSLEEAYEWYLTAKRQKDKYIKVDILKQVRLNIEEIK